MTEDFTPGNTRETGGNKKGIDPFRLPSKQQNPEMERNQKPLQTTCRMPLVEGERREEEREREQKTETQNPCEEAEG